MSPMMTDEEFTARAPWCHKGQADRHTQDRVAKEAKRARSEEARMLEENRKQAEQIKALADALLRNGYWVNGGKDWHSRRCPQSLPPAAAPCTCSDDRSALRLAGRLP